MGCLFSSMERDNVQHWPGSQAHDDWCFFVCIGFIGKLIAMLWKFTPMKLQRTSHLAFAVGTGQNLDNDATWAAGLELDDYEAIPTNIVSLLHLYFANGRESMSTQELLAYRLMAQCLSRCGQQEIAFEKCRYAS